MHDSISHDLDKDDFSKATSEQENLQEEAEYL